MPKKYLLYWGVAAIGLFGCGQRSPPPSARAQNSIAPGEIGSGLPEFSITDFQGRKLTSNDLHGKIVLIDFWATWCVPCKTEMPGYQLLVDQYESRGLVVIGLKFDTMQDTEEPVQFAKRIGVHYPLAVATDELRNKFGGIEGLPTTMIYDREGILRKKVIGFEYTSVIEIEVKHLL